MFPALTITQAANAAVAVPGQAVGYTVTVTDTGQTSYAAAAVSIPLAGMLGDAAYNGDAAATAGSVSYASPVLTWTGDLTPGQTATITFTVTVNNPDTGSKDLLGAVSSAAAGSSCPPGSTAAGCSTSVVVLTPALTITTAAVPATATPGATVAYTVTVTDTGQTRYTGATLTDPLTGVLGDAAYNGDAAATAGTVTYASPALTWTGTLNPGDAATITFTVTVHSPDTGNHILASTVTSATAGSNCPAGGTDPRCTATVPVSDLVIDFTASATTVIPGGTLVYTATFTNAGQTPYYGISVSTGTVALAANVTSDGNITASSGTLSIGATGTVWTGDIPVGGTVTITSPVTVDNPVTSDVLTATAVSTAPGNNCPPGGTDPRCTPVTEVLFPALTITKTAAVSTTTPGAAVSYTITVTDTGPTSYTAATITDALDGVLPDATYDNDATATAGTLSYASPDLTWTGDLSPGATAVITYTVTVADPDTGDKHLVNTVTSTTQGSTCPPGTTNPACTATVTDLIPALTITAAAPATATPGATVTYTVTVTDTGQTTYTGASITDPLTGVLDDAAYNNDAAATAGDGHLRQPGPDLDRHPGPRRHCGHHLHGHREQPRHRQRDPDLHRDLGRDRQQLPGRRHRPPLRHHHRHRDPHHRLHRQRQHHHPRLRGDLHPHHHQHRPDHLHRCHRHRPADRRPGTTLPTTPNAGTTAGIGHLRQPHPTWTGHPWPQAPPRSSPTPSP